jgi:5-methylcytosine-specific restriction endonuclease McrA
MARACVYRGPGCSDSGRALPGTSRCANHTLRSGWAAYKPAHSNVYRSAAWAELRAQVLREQPICAEPGCSAAASQVDHIVGLAQGGAPYARANVRGLCAVHHRRRSSSQGGQAKKAKYHA